MIQTLLSAALLLPCPSPAVQEKPPEAAPAVPRLAWYSGSLEAAVNQGKELKRIVLGYFGPESDEMSKAMLQVTFANPQVVAALADVVCVRVDITSLTPLASSVPVRSLPVTVFYSPDGTPRDRIDGAQDAETFLAELARIRSDIGTVNDLKKKLVGRENDVDAQFELFLKLRAVGDVKGMEEARATILKLDPAGTSRARMRFRYEEITTTIENHWAQTRQLLMPKVEELRLFVEGHDDPEVVWDGWMRLANTHEYLERQAGANTADAKKHRSIRRECLAKAWRALPQYRDYVHKWCFQYAELFWNQRDELSEDDKAFFSALTQRMVQTFDRDGGAWYYRACALMLRGQKEDALAAIGKAIELMPNETRFKDFQRDIRAR